MADTVIYSIEAPNGQTYKIPGPPGASQEEVQSEVLRQHPDAGKTGQSEAQQATPLRPNAFAETAGGAALGRPVNRGQLNVQEKPRPLESAMAGLTKSMVDIPVGAAQLATGGNLGTSQLAQRLGQQATQYQEENPKSYVAGRVAGAVAPAVGASNIIGAIPSFAKSAPLIQNVGMGAAMGAMTPEETGKTGVELYKEQAKQGVIGGTIGAALTPLQKLAGVLRGPEQTSQMASAVEKARGAGYVVPPTQANESLVNRVLEGTAGKVTTAQNASAKNQVVTNKLAAKAIGLPEDELITPTVLKDIRTEAGDAYEALASLPIKPEVLPSSTMNIKGSPEIDPKKMVYDLRLIRNNADSYYKAYQRSADPEQLTRAKQAQSAAAKIESTLEDYAKSLGKEELLPALRDARQLIAKTYTIEKALNPVSGAVEAKSLARELRKGKPLSEELKTVAEFSTQFPKATQTTEAMGSRPQISPLDIGVSGIVSAITQNPKALASMMVRPAARAAALSPAVQNRLIQGELTPEQVNLAKLLMLQSGIPAANALIKGKENE